MTMFSFTRFQILTTLWGVLERVFFISKQYNENDSRKRDRSLYFVVLGVDEERGGARRGRAGEAAHGKRSKGGLAATFEVGSAGWNE